jgi:hypothetical protein
MTHARILASRIITQKHADSVGRCESARTEAARCLLGGGPVSPSVYHWICGGPCPAEFKLLDAIASDNLIGFAHRAPVAAWKMPQWMRDAWERALPEADTVFYTEKKP